MCGQNLFSDSDKCAETCRHKKKLLLLYTQWKNETSVLQKHKCVGTIMRSFLSEIHLNISYDFSNCWHITDYLLKVLCFKTKDKHNF